MECADTMPLSASFALFAFAILLLSGAFSIVLHTLDNVFPRVFELDCEAMKSWMRAHAAWMKVKNWSEK